MNLNHITFRVSNIATTYSVAAYTAYARAGRMNN